MQNQPSPNGTTANHVFITVAGGVAYIAQAPESVQVHVIDYDDLEADFGRTFGSMSSEARAFYLMAEKSLRGAPND